MTSPRITSPTMALWSWYENDAPAEQREQPTLDDPARGDADVLHPSNLRGALHRRDDLPGDRVVIRVRDVNREDDARHRHRLDHRDADRLVHDPGRELKRRGRERFRIVRFRIARNRYRAQVLLEHRTHAVGVERADERDGELARVRVRRVEVLARAKRAHLSNVRRFQRPRHVRPPVREVSNRLVEQRVRIPRPVPNRLLLHPQDRFELLRNEHVSDVRREQRVGGVAVDAAVVRPGFTRDVAAFPREHVGQNLRLQPENPELGRDRVRVQRVEVLALRDLAQASFREASHEDLIVQKVRGLHPDLHPVAQRQDLEPDARKRSLLRHASRRREGLVLQHDARDLEHRVLRDLSRVFLSLYLPHDRLDLLHGRRPSSLHDAYRAARVDAKLFPKRVGVRRAHLLRASLAQPRFFLRADDELASQEVPDELVAQGRAVRLVALDVQLLRLRELLRRGDLELLLGDSVKTRARHLSQTRSQPPRDLPFVAHDLNAKHRRRSCRVLHRARRAEERRVRLPHDLIQAVIDRELERLLDGFLEQPARG
eukprot:31093-Pelagococcus_subviridis.AAC.3